MSEQIVETEHRVTPLELFFDLVFVFAFTQVTTLLLEDVSWAGLGRGLLVLAVLWWAWASYAWLTNTVDGRPPRCSWPHSQFPKPSAVIASSSPWLS